MLRAGTRAQACFAIWTAVAFAMVVVCGGCSGSSPVGNTPASKVGTCAASDAAMLTQHDMPGFAEIYRFTNTKLPGSHGIAAHPRWDTTQYICGQSYGFISHVIMTGRYRAQDNALARSLGYPIGKIPLLPYEGPAVSQLPHAVFEAYEEVFQFRSAKAAGMWLADGRRSPTPHPALTGLTLPNGFTAIPGVAGPDNGRDEHGIGISGQRGNLVIVVSFQGGKELAWGDVKTIWSRAYTHLAETLPKA